MGVYFSFSLLRREPVPRERPRTDADTTRPASIDGRRSYWGGERGKKGKTKRKHSGPRGVRMVTKIEK